MYNCDSCPYPARCDARGHCISGKARPEGESLPQPKPMPVLTTAGMGTTGVAKPILAKVKTKKKKAVK